MNGLSVLHVDRALLADIGLVEDGDGDDDTGDGARHQELVAAS